MDNKKTILVLAPHTDDGELGCGGAIAKFCAAGKDVYYVAFSSCSKSLPADLPDDILVKEVSAATKSLGVPSENLFVHNFEVRMFKDHRQEILEEMIRLKNEIKPDLIFTPSPTDIHQDHQVISEEAIRAFKSFSILGYEMPWNNLSFNTRCFIALSDDDIKAKTQSLMHYKSQLNRIYFQEENIRSQARMRGVQLGVDWAEAYEVIRWVM